MTGPVQGFVVLDGETLLEALKATAGTYIPEPRRPMTDEQIAYESRCDDLAEDRKHEREAGVSGAESDRRADLEWQQRGGF